jgi:hypothetical protein
MRKIFFLLFTFSAGLFASAQTKGTAKIYGYKEPVSGAVSQRAIDENGKPVVSDPAGRFNYFIYLVTPNRVYPSELWLNGEVYSVKIETVKETPVVRKNFNNPSEPQSTELVPATTQLVIRLSPGPAITDKLSEKGEILSKENELVVVYKQNGKFDYETLSSLTLLEVAALQ